MKSKYYDKMLNETAKEEDFIVIRHENTNIGKASNEEIKEIINNLKINKSPGRNGITVQNIKYAREELIQKVYIEKRTNL